nr:hypothetical protein [Anaerolineae bacterium]NIN95478.1 hypothetical protein [Anaerolineae bacterium]
MALSLVGCLLAGCIMYDSLVTGIAWEDANCDGVQGSGEPALQGVCVWASTNPAAPGPSILECADEGLQTNAHGRADAGFWPGRRCSEIFVFARVPDGYQPTTEIAVNDCWAEFGFARESTCPERPLLTQAELTKRQTIKKAASYLVWFLVLPGAAIGVGVLLLQRRARPT